MFKLELKFNPHSRFDVYAQDKLNYTCHAAVQEIRKVMPRL